MSNKVANIIAFSLGAAIGAVVTWKVVKTKYERLAQQEIDSVKEAYSRRANKKSEEGHEEVTNTLTDEEDKANKAELERITSQLGYNTIPVKESKPYVISPDDFGDGEYDYEVVSLTYYDGDSTLVGQGDDVIGNVDDIVGLESLMHFGEYEDGAVHVRNDRLKTDYEILLDGRKWSEVSQSEDDDE